MSKKMQDSATDVHSFARPDEAIVRDLDLDLKVDFTTKTLSGCASYKIDNLKGVDHIFLDTRDLEILKVTLDASEKETQFGLGEPVEFLGRPLRIQIEPGTKYLHIYYKTSPDAAAVQWLSPQQTAGKKHPFLFTQSEAILARTWVPCQDGPAVRFTYTATVEVPKELMALMSAENPTKKSKDGIYHFDMPEPIPSYLLALSVGDLVFKPIGKHTGVYAEPVTLEKAADEFVDMEKMLTAAEELYGPYRWGRYDVLVLPPSFPFGGMENPRLTFATPTILAGDRSLVSLVAHELAHSWSGNLVTNATWNDFWLNEGFTVYFERRIMEALEGKDYANMLEVLGYQDLQRTVSELGAKSEDTQLKLNLQGRDPDDGMTQIAYEKGYFLLRHLEDKVGRKRFDEFVKEYFSSFAFQSMNTEKFLNYLDNGLLEGNTKLQDEVRNWIYKPGIPKTIEVVHSERFDKVNKALEHWGRDHSPKELHTSKWSTHEWLQFIRHLPKNTTIEQMARLDNAFGLTHSGNAEILAAWFEHVIVHRYEPAYPSLEAFMTTVGRRKFILPLYKKLIATPEGTKMAEEIYQKARKNYHAVTISSVDEILHWQEAPVELAN